MMEEMSDRSALWLPLLRRLTDRVPEWSVYKNSDSALYGMGDVDCVAPKSVWPAVQREFMRWAGERDLGPVFLCNHVRPVLFLIAAPSRLPNFLEMDVTVRRTWRGSPLFGAAQIQQLTELDPLGFRRLRPGAEGLFKLAFNGIRWNGSPDLENMRTKNVVGLLKKDPEGVRLAAQVSGLPAGPVLRVVDHLLAGEWNYPAVNMIQARSLLAGLRHPWIMLETARLKTKLLMKAPPCCILETMLYAERRIPPDRDAWLHAVERTHDVHHHPA